MPGACVSAQIQSAAQPLGYLAAAFFSALDLRASLDAEGDVALTGHRRPDATQQLAGLRPALALELGGADQRRQGAG